MTARNALSSNAALSLCDVTKKFGGHVAVNNLTFSVDPGEIFGFLGPNGAGKTTTLRMVLDIIPPSSGQIVVLGSQSARVVRGRIGYLPEERGLYRKMKAVDSIAYFARLKGLERRAAYAKAHELLERFDLGEFAKSRNEALSKGMAQKVQLLATIAHDPDLLILDEPFSGLDPINQATLEALISELREQGRTIVFSTHVMEHAERLCDRFLILAKGEKRLEGTLDEARAIFPQHLLIRTTTRREALAGLPHVQGIEEIGEIGVPGPGAAQGNGSVEREFKVRLDRAADPHEILRAMMSRDFAFTKFDAARASLHEIFVAMAGDKATNGQAGADASGAPSQPDHSGAPKHDDHTGVTHDDGEHGAGQAGEVEAK